MSVPKTRGFTLIELLITISIIAVLATIGLTSFAGVQKNARISKRVEDLKNIQTALEIYRNVRGGYPVAASYGCVSAALGALEPNYMIKVPEDPLYVPSAAVSYCYQYTSDGANYKLRTNANVSGTEMTAAQFNTQPSLVDPTRDTTPGNGCQVDPAGSGWAYYTPAYCSN